MQQIENTSRGAIIRALLRHRELSRPDLATLTGLSRSVITMTTLELLDWGLIQKAGSQASTGGRRPDLFRLGGGPYRAVGIAFEDDTAVAVLYTLDGIEEDRTRLDLRLPIPLEGATRCIEHLLATLRDHSPDVIILGIALALSSLVDAETDTVTSTSSGWSAVPARLHLEARLGAPVSVIDNAHAAVLGELWLRGRELRENVIYLYVGRGVGGAVVIDQDIYYGRNHAAGEFGRITVGGVDTEGFPFFGRVEDLTDLETLRAWYRGTFTDHADADDVLEADVEVLGALMAAGERKALVLMNRTAAIVGACCANLINTFNPDEIIIGGPMSQWGAPFIEEIYRQAAVTSIPIPYQTARILEAGPRDQTIPLGAASTMIQRTAELIAGRRRVITLEGARSLRV